MRPIYLISKTPHEGVIHIPILTISFLNPVIDFTQYEGVIFTSKQAISALKKYDLDWNTLKYICVSEGTAVAAREAGAVDIESADGYGASIPTVLKTKKRQGKWLYVRPKVIASEWVEHARSAGFTIDEAIAYETTCNVTATDYPISDEGVLIFTSPSSIHCFLQNYSVLPTHKIVVIGKTTQNALPAGLFSSLSVTPSIASAVELARQIIS